jgi:hypothetical protein
MTDPQVQYRFALLKESMRISGQFLLIRLHLKTVSKEERAALNRRAELIRRLMKNV